MDLPLLETGKLFGLNLLFVASFLPQKRGRRGTDLDNSTLIFAYKSHHVTVILQLICTEYKSGKGKLSAQNFFRATSTLNFSTTTISIVIMPKA